MPPSLLDWPKTIRFSKVAEYHNTTIHMVSSVTLEYIIPGEVPTRNIFRSMFEFDSNKIKSHKKD